MPIDSYRAASGRPRDRDQAAAQIAALQAELKRLRSDRDDEVARLERQLALARTALPTERNAGAVASNLAAQQQIDALRLALQEKDRIIDELSATVRILEDKLEDHYRNLDHLNQQLHEYERQRAEAEARAARAERRLARARAAADGHRGTPDSSVPVNTPTSIPTSTATGTPTGTGASPTGDLPGRWEPTLALTPTPAAGTTPTPQRRAPTPRSRRHGSGTLLLAALLGAAIMLAFTAALWWSGRWWPQPQSLSPANPVTMPATNGWHRPIDARHG